MKHKVDELDTLRTQLRHTQQLVLLGLFIVGMGVFIALFDIQFVGA